MTDISRNDPIKLPAHSIGGVLGHFNLAASDVSSVAARAIRFVYRVMEHDFDGAVPGQNKRDFAKDIAQYTINNIEFRIDLYKGYKDDYFRRNEKINHEALEIAAICGPITHGLNEPQALPAPAMPHDNENLGETFLCNDGFDHETVIAACNLWEDADDVAHYGYDSETEYLWPEVRFLAHIRAMEILCEHEQDLNDKSYEEHSYFLNKVLPPIASLVNHDSEIGRALTSFINHLEQRVVDALLQSDSSTEFIRPPDMPLSEYFENRHPEPKKPYLFIVPSPPRHE